MKSTDFKRYVQLQLLNIKMLEETELRYNLNNIEDKSRVFIENTEGLTESQLAAKCPLITAESGDGNTYWYVTSVYIDKYGVLCVRAVDSDNTIIDPELFYVSNIPVGNMSIINEWICFAK